MKYLKDIVKYKNPKFPIISYYELNEEHYMLRVIEFFEDGRVDTIIADAYMQEEPLPSIEEMNSEKYNESGYFVFVSQEEFESLWNKYAVK